MRAPLVSLSALIGHWLVAQGPRMLRPRCRRRLKWFLLPQAGRAPGLSATACAP